MADSPGDRTSCPTPAALAAFLCDELPPAQMDEIGAHVSVCRHCDAAVGRMDEATDATFKELARLLHNRAMGGEPADPEYRRMLTAVQATSPTKFLSATPLPTNLPLPPQIGQYRIGERLGQGGMGAVYRAEHTRLKKTVAIKILSAGQTRDRRAVARFQLEMESVGRLDHPNIVRATDAGEADGVHFLVMELISGLNFSHLLYRRGPLPVTEACELIRQAAVGLQCAHEHGLVHRDVKPSNLMLSSGGQVKLLDLGLALLRANSPGPGDLTGIGEVMGTAEYMAPEQWAETHLVDIRADIYSLGCTLYALLTGDPPFGSTSRRSLHYLMVAHQNERPPALAAFRDDVPPALAALLERMLAKNPDDRPATPVEVAVALEPLAAGAELSRLIEPSPDAKTIAERFTPARPTPTPPVTTAPAPRPSRRRLAIGAAIVLAAAGVGGYFAIHGVQSPGKTDPAPDGKQPHDPKKWRNLLAARPTERFWFPGPDALLHHQPDKEVLTIHSSHPALVRLGETDAAGYKLQVGFRQPQWTGSFGVYFGGRAGAEPNAFAFQVIHLRHTRVRKGYGLSRAAGSFPLGPVTQPEVPLTGIETADLPPPGNEEQLLELEVKPNGLAAVRWNGAACPKLVNESAIRLLQNNFPHLQLMGEFGVYCNGSAVTVSTARFVVTE